MPRSFLIKKRHEIEKKPNSVEFRGQLILPANPGELGKAESLINTLPSNAEVSLSQVPSTRNYSTATQLFIKEEDEQDEKLNVKLEALHESAAQETLLNSRGRAARIEAAHSYELNIDTPYSMEALVEANSVDPHDGRCYNSMADASRFSSNVASPETLHFPLAESLTNVSEDQKSTASSYEVLSEDFQLTDFIQFAESCISGSPCNSPGSSSMTDSSNSEATNAVTHNVMSSMETKDCNSPQDVEQTDGKKYRYTCDVCGKSFSRSNTLTTHKRIHSGDKPFKCEQCGRAFRQPGNLTRHRLTHTTAKPYVCPQCNKAFNRASNLHTHMRTHTNFKPFVCDFCGKGFHQKIDMKIHRYTHTGEKPHKCQKCGRGFKQLTHLTYHLRTHSDVRMYECEYCGKGFNQKGNLQAHIYGHTGQRPYKCDVCDKGFTLASTLNTHKRTHASKKPFQCELCEKAFYQKNALKTHYIASHPFANGVSLL